MVINQRRKREENKMKRAKINIFLIFFIILFSNNLIDNVMALDINEVSIDDHEGMLNPGEILDFEFKKDIGTKSWIIDMSSNGSLDLFLVYESGKNYLLSNNASFVEKDDLIKKGVYANITLKITSNTTQPSSIWCVIKNFQDYIISFRITSFSSLYNRTTLKLVLILVPISYILGFVTMYIIIKKRKYKRRLK